VFFDAFCEKFLEGDFYFFPFCQHYSLVSPFKIQTLKLQIPGYICKMPRSANPSWTEDAGRDREGSDQKENAVYDTCLSSSCLQTTAAARETSSDNTIPTSMEDVMPIIGV
jgi:hypothetical protein